MASLSQTIEAILYLKAKPLTIAQVAEYASCDKAAAQEGMIQLMGEYAHRESALEIAETENGYSLQLRQPFKPLLDELIPLDIGLGALRTLAAIAMRGPLSQTDLVELRGSGAYGHVHDLVDQGLVRRRRQADGRSFWLQVTEKFYQRFEIDKLPQINLPDTISEPPPAEESVAQLSMENLADPVAKEMQAGAVEPLTDEASISEPSVMSEA
ncbi:MAG: SMC-Scp complex subunit ScpB [Cyanobacteria bacterium P01_D01_bin.156]